MFCCERKLNWQEKVVGNFVRRNLESSRIDRLHQPKFFISFSYPRFNLKGIFYSANMDGDFTYKIYKFDSASEDWWRKFILKLCNSCRRVLREGKKNFPCVGKKLTIFHLHSAQIVLAHRIKKLWVSNEGKSVKF